MSLLKENIEANLHGPGLCNGILNVTPKAEQKQQKIDMLDFLPKLKTCVDISKVINGEKRCLTYKKAIKGVKNKQTKTNRKTYLPIMSERKWCFRKKNVFITQQQNEKQLNFFKYKDMNRHFFKEDYK